MWFIIEILSFYGTIISAVYFIMHHQIMSSLEMNHQEDYLDRFKYGFLKYHRYSIHYLSFALILLINNSALLYME